MRRSTAWSPRTTTRDEAYDGGVLDRFAEFDLRVDPICADLSGALARFSRYRVRLADALTRARSGALDYVADNLESTTPCLVPAARGSAGHAGPPPPLKTGHLSV